MSDQHHNQIIAVVTGASRGLGFEVSRQLAQQGMTVLLTGRDQEKGEAAANTLVQEGLYVRFKPLDITDDASVNRIASEMETEFGKLDVLVNNAASGFDFGDTASNVAFKQVQDVLETNLFGAWRMVRAFTPLLKKSPHARIVNVSSGAGSFQDQAFGLIVRGSEMPVYGISKAALNALTVKLAADLKTDGILINAVCPGLTATWPGAEAMGARPIPEGAKSIVWAATLPDGGPTGGFFRDEKPLPW